MVGEVLSRGLSCLALYCIVLYCIVLYCTGASGMVLVGVFLPVKRFCLPPPTTTTTAKVVEYNVLCRRDIDPGFRSRGLGRPGFYACF